MSILANILELVANSVEVVAATDRGKRGWLPLAMIGVLVIVAIVIIVIATR